MVASGSVAVPPNTPQQTETSRLLATPDLPHAFYVAQVRRQLASQANENIPGSSEPQRRAGSAHPSVFHAWALSD